ncbi:MAG TPA: helicase-related protein, partial [Myxococcota bacterium]|nr:helicase-related protein [Myxococcota bacterium]
EADLAATVARDFEGLDELADELDGEEEEEENRIDPALLAEELGELSEALQLSEGIAENAKGEALLRALARALELAVSKGAANKAVVFTESRRTQDYLARLLENNGYAGRILTLNGTNADPASRALYDAWVARHTADDLPTGSRAVDTRAAIVEAFRDRGTILLATEAAAEGVNLQFCSLVVNYDLPWNPQRVEQRIGRCHRYGQKHEVVVVNFLNQRNAADQRVYQLLAEKFRLFEGVFGASDEVLGALESGIDVERRIAEVYRTCRTAEEIQAAFDTLQAELAERIQAQLARTREKVIDHFDEDVHARLQVHREGALASLSQRERWLLNLTRTELAAEATFDPDKPRFLYRGVHATKGWYNLDWRAAEARCEHFYRVDHPLAARLVTEARSRPLRTRRLHFDYSGHGAQIAVLAPFLGRSGWLSLGLLTVTSLDVEEFLLFAGLDDTGQPMEAEVCARFLHLRAQVGEEEEVSPPDLSAPLASATAASLAQVEARNGRYFDAEVAKLDRWSDDLKLGLEHELRDL